MLFRSSLVATRDADCGDVVRQPVLRLGGAVVLGCVPRECESPRELLGPDVRSEAAMRGNVFLLDDA